MRKMAISILSLGGTGAATGVAGSSAELQAVTAKATATATALAAARIPGDRRLGACPLVADEQGEIGRDRDALGLAVALGVKPSAGEHLPGGVDLGDRALGAGDENQASGTRVPHHRGAREPLHAGG